ALPQDGDLTVAPLFALTAAAAVVLAGAAAARGAAAPPDASRYRTGDEQPGDDEWTLASGDDG
ncbi:MAG TPA: hypothetical protein VM307_13700, partial [Egibacteraceae bacterium]|nr:hypothetical protein [Egibacteraceae bacterium]